MRAFSRWSKPHRGLQQAGSQAGSQQAGSQAGSQQAGSQAGSQQAGAQAGLQHAKRAFSRPNRPQHFGAQPAGSQQAGSQAGSQQAGSQAGSQQAGSQAGAQAGLQHAKRAFRRAKRPQRGAQQGSHAGSQQAGSQAGSQQAGSQQAGSQQPDIRLNNPACAFVATTANSTAIAGRRTRRFMGETPCKGKPSGTLFYRKQGKADGSLHLFGFCLATSTVGLKASLPVSYPGMSGIDTQSSANLANPIDGELSGSLPDGPFSPTLRKHVTACEGYDDLAVLERCLLSCGPATETGFYNRSRTSHVSHLTRTKQAADIDATRKRGGGEAWDWRDFPYYFPERVRFFSGKLFVSGSERRG